MWRILLLVVLVLADTVSYAASETELSGATRFWSSFRTAVLNNDDKAIRSMAKFPFEVRGVADSDPIRSYTAKEFPTVFRQILSQTEYVPEGEKLVPITVHGVIYRTKKLRAADVVTPDFFRISQLVFQRVKGKWHCTGGYLEE